MLKTLFKLFLGLSSLIAIIILVLMKHQHQHQHQHSKNNSNQSPSSYLYPPPWRLIDLHLSYIANSDVCLSKQQQQQQQPHPFALIIITSHSKNTETRAMIRDTVPQAQLEKLGMKRIFLLAAEQQPSSSSIQEESRRHGDIVSGDFAESYRNLTYKHLMGLQWVERYCGSAQFIVKQDDDVFVDYFQLPTLRILSSLQDSYFILGKVLKEQVVERGIGSKWFVPKSEYAGQTYPPFVSGWGYITTPKVAQALVEASQQQKYFWIDDAHITGTLREASTTKIELIDLDDQFTIYRGALHCCVAASSREKVAAAAASPPYWCDYLVGPPNGDSILYQALHHRSKICWERGGCGRRVGKERLRDTCVVTPNMVQFQPKNTSFLGSWKKGLIRIKT